MKNYDRLIGCFVDDKRQLHPLSSGVEGDCNKRLLFLKTTIAACLIFAQYNLRNKRRAELLRTLRLPPRRQWRTEEWITRWRVEDRCRWLDSDASVGIVAVYDRPVAG